MARFLSLGFGAGLINPDRIDRVEPVDRDQGLRSIATLSDGSRGVISGDVYAIEKLMLPVVAAAPGFTLLRFFGPVGVRGPNGERLPHAGEGDAYVERMPIVAWRIDETHAVPVTSDDDDGRISNLIGSGVLLPDGQVVVPFDATFDNEEAWRTEMSRRPGNQSKLKVVE